MHERWERTMNLPVDSGLSAQSINRLRRAS
jgi:hypothetical protein